MKGIILILLFITSFGVAAQPSLHSDFEDGSLQGWTNTDTTQTLLTVENESDFWYLRKECDGSNSAIGEMAIINSTIHWTGNHWYEPSTGEIDLAQVREIVMRNSNNFDLHIRIGITGSNGFQVVTTTPTIIPAQSGWALYETPGYGVDWLSLYNLTVLNDTSGMTAMEINQHVIDMFEGVIEYRIIHNAQAEYDGEIVNGLLEIDELITIWLLSNEEISNSDFVIFPNPTSDNIHITSKKSEIKSVTIYSSLGKMVLQPKLIPSATIDLSHLTDGIYFLQIESDHGREVHKIVKR